MIFIVCGIINLIIKTGEAYDTNILLVPDDSCSTNKCQHESTCTPVPRIERRRNNRTLLKYKCHCQFGFVGELCERDTRACFTPPLPRCRNNGTCVQSQLDSNDFECECVYGFRGRLCEENVLCENVTCLNSGLCIDGVTEYD